MKDKVDLYVVNKVKARRVENKISQAALAYDLDVSIGFIGQCESSKYAAHYNVKHLNKLGRILKCSPQDFLPVKPI